jgi:DNA-binding transcriptional regulator/RsmH inhibitor MraZ
MSGTSLSYEGTTHTTTDSKGRVAVPEAILPAMGAECVLVCQPGLKRIQIYSSCEYHSYCQEEFGGFFSQNQFADIYRFALIADVKPSATVDSQGRILIPADMRRACGIEKEITFIGSSGKLFIYASHVYASAILLNDDVLNYLDKLSQLRARAHDEQRKIQATIDSGFQGLTS